VFDYTTPTNGRYTLKVPSSASYSLKIESQVPGYQTVSQPITIRIAILRRVIPAD